MPKIMVTGLNRSGTSAISHLIAQVCDASLLDDPEWAISGPVGALSYRTDPSLVVEITGQDIVKCPRMCEFIDIFLNDFQYTRVIFVVRDPRDVWASVMEKVRLGRPTRMLDNDRFGYYSDPVEGFILQVRHYYRMMLLAHSAYKERVQYVNYETFMTNKITTVSRLASWAELQARRDLKDRELQYQYGPSGHKQVPTMIRGVGRWVTDITKSEATQIMDDIGRDYAKVCQLETIDS